MDIKQAQLLLKHENLTTILLEIEDLLDSLDLYVFDNWFEGEIYSGPEIRRYWVDVVLSYPYELMPDPDGAVRLQNNNINVYYDKTTRTKTVQKEIEDGNGTIKNAGKPKEEKETIWLVNMSIPRKFISELDDDDLQLVSDDTVDTDDISDARDQNVDDTDAFVDNQNSDELSDEEQF